MLSSDALFKRRYAGICILATHKKKKPNICFAMEENKESKNDKTIVGMNMTTKKSV